jgi:hypothetical protein
MTDTKKPIEAQRAEAFERLESKIKILEDWAVSGIPFKLRDAHKQVNEKGKLVLEYFPTSISGLRLWNATQNSEDVTKKFKIPTSQTSDKTWKAAPSTIRIRVEGNEDKLSLFMLLKETALIQSSNKEKTKIQKLEEKLELSEMNRKGLANELIELRLANKFFEEELSTAENKIKGTQEVMSQQLDWKKNMLKQAENKTYELNIELNRLRRLLTENGIEWDFNDEVNTVIDFPGNKDDD